MRYPLVILLACLGFVAACDIAGSGSDTLEVLDDPHVELVFAAAPVAESETIVDVFVDQGQYDDWQYDWELEGEYELLFGGAKMLWTPPFGPDSLSICVTVTNDTVSYQHLEYVAVAQPAAPDVKLICDALLVDPDDWIELRCEIGTSPFPVSIEWFAEQGLFTDYASELVRYSYCSPGVVEIGVRVANSHFETTVFRELTVLQTPPRIELVGSYSEPTHRPGDSMSISAHAYNENCQLMELGLEVDSGLIVDELMVENDEREAFLFAFVRAEEPGEYDFTFQVNEAGVFSRAFGTITILP